jgi:predicted O-linked N-acetylglucosamine transferase (SPINDLY family)
LQEETLTSLENWLLRGKALASEQRWPEAVAAFLQAVQLDGNDPDAWWNLGLAQQNAQDLSAAEQAFARCLAIAPGRLDATICYAQLLNEIGQPERALELLAPALQRAPQLGIAWLILGNAYKTLGDIPAAIDATRRAVAYTPQPFEAQFLLADLLSRVWRLDECEAVLEGLLAQQPNYADARVLLGICLRAQARHVESLAALRHSLVLQHDPHRHSIYLAGLHYVEGTTPQSLLAAHREWNRLSGGLADPVTACPPTGRAPGKLRLGFVSADFASHPIGYLALPALQALDKSRVEMVCYSDRTSEDDITAQFRHAATAWRTIRGRSDDEVADQIRADGVHLLFDLAGHFGERMTLYRHKPAPRQISWLGYVGTTGLAMIDFLLADRFHIPAGEDHCYIESVLRLPADYACYQPPEVTPPVGSLPAFSAGRVTFGCFNNPAKYSPRLFDAWAAVLRETPGSQLFLKFGGLDQPRFAARLAQEFAKRSIDPNRLILEPMAPHYEALEAYGRVDLALDTQPYSGGLTTCEALWMGVPVVTFPGPTFAARHSTSHLSNAGLSQFVAADWNGYVELALRWSRDLPALAALRLSLRDQLRTSRLCDASAFAADFLRVLETCWP